MFKKLSCPWDEMSTLNTSSTYYSELGGTLHSIASKVEDEIFRAKSEIHNDIMSKFMKIS